MSVKKALLLEKTKGGFRAIIFKFQDDVLTVEEMVGAEDLSSLNLWFDFGTDGKPAHQDVDYVRMPDWTFEAPNSLSVWEAAEALLTHRH